MKYNFVPAMCEWAKQVVHVGPFTTERWILLVLLVALGVFATILWRRARSWIADLERSLSED